MEGAQIGPYRVLGELGSGGMGKVYLAAVSAHAPGLDDGCRVALKIIHPHLLETPGFFKRFLREAEIGQSVAHDNVVRCFDCDAVLHGGVQQNYLVMEYVEGQTLRALLEELGKVPEELCRHIGREIANGLAAIHDAGVIHRDLKPENVLITQDHVVKVMDLGVARLKDEAFRLSDTGAFVGSLPYAAPEQFGVSDGEPDARADLYGLGVVLYELSTGTHPYRDRDLTKLIRKILEEEPRPPGEVNPQLSPFFEDVVQTLLAKDRDARFEGAAQLARVLEDGEESDWWGERVQVLRVETRRPLRRIHVPRETALYGRDDDLTELHARYEAVMRGEGQVLLIAGEAGIGKTRLVDEFAGRLRAQGEDLNFLFGSYPPGGAATAVGAFATAYREHFGSEGLENVLPAYLGPSARLVPAFAALLRGESPPPEAEPLTKDALQTVFINATRALGEERPTLVLIDDLHFAPEDGRALFSSLAMAVQEHPILLIGTMRPGVPEAWTADVTRPDHADLLALARLGPKDLAKLLEDAFHSERLARELGHQIAVKSDGNPFFALEIIRGLRDGLFIAQQPDGSWVETGVIQDVQVPSSVLELVNARVAGLTDDERNLLDVASCAGFEFDPSLVGSVLGLARVPTLQTFGRIEKRNRLVRSSGRNYVFDHHQVQEALYDALNEQLREEYHGAIAAALEVREGVGDRDPDQVPGALGVELCEHYLRSAQKASARRYLDPALGHLESSYRHGALLTLTQRALGETDLVEGALRGRLLLGRAGSLRLMGRSEETERALREALASAKAASDTSLCLRVLNDLGGFLSLQYRHEEALEVLHQGIELARHSDRPKAQAELHGTRADLLYLACRYEEARASAEASLQLHREVGAEDGERRVVPLLAGILVELGAWETAEAHLDRALVACREAGDRRAEAGVLSTLAVLMDRRRKIGESMRYCQATLDVQRELGSWDRGATMLTNLGLHLKTLGSFEEAEEHLEEARRLYREVRAHPWHADAVMGLASLCAEREQPESAQQLYEEALAEYRDSTYPSGVMYALRELGELHLACGRQPEAERCLEEALRLARDGGLLPEVAAVACKLTRLPAQDAAGARAALEEAGEAGDTREARFDLWQATGAPEHLAAARRLLEEAVESAPESYRSSMRQQVRLHRDILVACEEHEARTEGTGGVNG